nr:hypothetical protein [uncultured Methanoregula sp.]
MSAKRLPTGRFTALLPLCAALVFTLSGCGKQAEIKAKTSALERAFAAAAAAEAQVYVKAALAAVRTNDYAAGIIVLDSLVLIPGLTPEQLMAAQNAKQSLLNDLVDRAANGDVKARAMLDAREKTRSQ